MLSHEPLHERLFLATSELDLSYADFCKTARVLIPQTLMRMVASRSPSLRKKVSRLEKKLHRSLCGPVVPEIYWAVFSLLNSESKVSEMRSLRRLEALLSTDIGGAGSPHCSQAESSKKYVEARGINAADAPRLLEHTPIGPWIACAGVSNYREILGDERSSSTADAVTDEALGKIQQSLQLIERFSRRYYDQLKTQLSLIVSLPRVDDMRSSFSCRLYYFGGIFITPSGCTVCEVAEGILHEYIHLALWQWWFLETPSGLPEENLEVVSPVTGRPKSAQVMFHALIIYIEAAKLYHWSIEAGISTEKDILRHDQIRGAVAQIHRDLKQLTKRGTDMDTVLSICSRELRVPA